MSTAPQPKRPAASVPALLLAGLGPALHAVLAVGIVVTMVGHVWPSKRLFDEFGFALPSGSKAVLRVAGWMADYWWTLPPWVLLAAVAEAVLLYGVGRRRVLPKVRLLWVLGVAAVQIGLWVAVVAAVELPKADLVDALNH